MKRSSVRARITACFALGTCGTLSAQGENPPPVTAPFIAETVAPSIDG